VVSTYTGPVHFTSTDGRAILPADSRLINGWGISRSRSSL
jgi:hypothetical protein